jgi:hypothetical protein
MRTRFITILIVALIGAGSAAAASTPPRNTGRPSISGLARQGETFTADPGNWSGTQPMTFAYQWRRCDAAGANCSNISGATGKTYVLTSVDVGNRLRARVRASNSAGAGTATSLPSSVVAAQPPKSISLDTSRSLVVYGGTVRLFGSLANGQAGDTVTIEEHRLPQFNGLADRTAATVQTAADGSFSAVVRPDSRALYKATTGQTESNSVVVSVRPRLSLSRIARHRFALRATAARSFIGHYGVLQRWSRSRHLWISRERVSFTRAIQNVSPTITSLAVFRVRFGGARVRVLVPQSQVGPSYVAASSNILSA